MASLSYVDVVDRDLDQISTWSPEDGDDLRAFLQELEDSGDLLERLSSWHYAHAYADPQFDCRAIDCLQRRGYNVYRLKALRLEWARRYYRIVYAYDVAYDDFIVLAVVLRLTDRTPPELREHCYDYQPNHPITQRICTEYERLELPVRH